MASNQNRKPRFRRVSDVKFRLQKRDVDIIKLVDEYRFLPSTHIAALVSGSRQGVLRRLNFLFHGGYLDRPPKQIKPYYQGTDPFVYGLGNKGADFLAETYHVTRSRVDWTSKNREVKRVYLEHTLMVANFMICLKLACRNQGKVRIIEPKEILENAPEKSQSKLNPFSWKVSVDREQSGQNKEFQLGVIPDKIFGLHFMDDPPGQNKAYFFLEADRSTMPVISSNLLRTSYYKKMVGYWASWEKGLFEKTFGFKNARVLTVTKSWGRIEHMISAGKKIDPRGLGSPMFLFLEAGRLKLDNPNAVLEKIWRNGKNNQPTSLID